MDLTGRRRGVNETDTQSWGERKEVGIIEVWVSHLFCDVTTVGGVSDLPGSRD